MANTAAPYGFSHIGYFGGQAPNFAPSIKKIAAANTNKIHFGSPVVQLNTGYIDVASPGTTQIAGIFCGCRYLSTSRGYTWKANKWLGADATGDVEAFVIDNPLAIFQCQSGTAAAVGLADVGANINFAIGTGNDSTGISGAYANQGTINPATTTLPFRIIGIVSDPSGVNGTDSTSAYNDIIVAFNNQDYRVLTGQ